MRQRALRQPALLTHGPQPGGSNLYVHGHHHYTTPFICQGMNTGSSQPPKGGQPQSGQDPERHATGRIRLLGLEGYGHHGDLPAERELGAQFSLDLELLTDTRAVAQTDTLRGAVDYVKIEALARRLLEGPPFRLLETLAERLAEAILQQPGVLEVTVRVTKRPPLPHLRAFTVEITRPL